MAAGKSDGGPSTTVARPIEFAPCGALRVAAWPIESLEPFGDRELLEEARSLRGSSSRLTAGFEAQYAAVIARERDALWAATAGDPRFLKALALANGPLLRRVRERARSRASERAPDKRTRHLETTLYRLLARAAYRTEPFGAWCGVGLVQLGDVTRVERVRPKRFVAPNLSFYVEALRVVSRSPDVRRLVRYRMNPTLGPHSDGIWAFWSPPGAPQTGYSTLPSHPPLEAAFERLTQLEAFTIPEAERALGVDPHVLDAFFFEQLIPQGIVLGGLSLPPFFSDPWDALQRLEAEEPLPNLPRWIELRRELAAICAEIEQTYDSADSDTIALLAERAAASGKRFAHELELDQIPELGLHVDTSAPFRLTLGTEFVASMKEAVRLDEADTSSVARAFNESLRRVQCQLLGADGVALATLSPQAFADVLHTEKWPRIPASDYFPDWPLRSALAHLSAGQGAEPETKSLNLVDDVASPLSRFLPLLSREDPALVNTLVGWLRTAHLSAGPPALGAIAEVNVPAPNAAAQPDLGLPRYSLWSSNASVGGLGCARVVGLTERGLVAIAADGAPLSLVSLSAVNLVRDDPVMQLLLMSSLRFPRPTAQLSHPSNPPPVLTEEFPRISASAVGRLSKQSGVQRFVAWTAALGELSGTKIVHRRNTSPLLVALDSPLAVSALLEGASEAWGDLELRHALTEPYLSDGEHHYVAQLVLPFRRVTI